MRYRIKDIARINCNTLPEDIDPGYRFRYIDIGAVDALGNISIPDEEIRFAQAPSRARRLAPAGSVIVSTVRTYLRAIASVPADNPSLVFSTGFAVLEAQRWVDSRFLAHYCRSQPFIDEVIVRSVGVSYPAINASEIGNIDISLPGQEEQRRIAEFLDQKTAHIDQAVAKRAEMIELLEFRTKAAIRRALRSSVASGFGRCAVPWLDAIPDRWSAAPLRHVARIQRGASPRPIDDPVYFDEHGSHAWVRISDVTASEKYLVKTTQRLSMSGVSLSVPLQPGELFVSIAGSVGKPIITQIPCCIHDGFVALRSPLVNVDFLYYVLLLGDAFQGLGKLGTQLNLNSETIKSIIIPIPTEAEQIAIVRELDTIMENVRRLRESLRRQRELLYERRQALITAAVTGQFDVSSASGRGVTDGVGL